MHVRLDELGGAEDRTVDVCLGGEVDDRLAPGGRLCDRVGVADVADDELDSCALEVRGVPGVRQLVEDDDLVALRREPLCKVGADEPGPAGNEHLHRPQG